jgi:uncharacterized protein (TIGR02145 family)
MAVVQIGSQFWTKENLAVESFQDGTPITECSSSEQWQQLAIDNKPAWCYYKFDASNEEEYGKLYNWYVVSSSRQVAPVGFRVPTTSDWDTLISQLGGEKAAGYKLKNDVNWNTMNRISGNGNNQSEFTANPSGYIKENGDFWDFGWSANYWSQTTASANSSVSVRLYWQNKDAIKIDGMNDMGLAIRLISSGSYTGSLSDNPTQNF